MPRDTAGFGFDNSFAREMETFYVPWQGEEAPAPKLVQFNHALAEELGLDAAALDGDEGAAIFSGSVAPEGSSPLAQVYAGHQFGGFSPQLGDGRALLIGEVIDRNGQRRDIQLKGSGRTPFSRQGDGKAVLGPVLREYLMGEAMHALGIPTSRALAAVTTGEQIMRDGPEPGAVLTRVAASHLRVGTFQFFAAQQDMGKVQRLADYAIRRHYRDLENRDGRYLAFLRAIIDRQASLIAGWMRVGFIHGVMNTDNMTISGETIDYGPCAFMDVYSPDAVFSSIDYQGRYAFGNQQRIGQWNLARLAETLLPLIHQDREESIRIATAEISAYPAIFEGFWLSGMRAKLGLATQEDGDMALAQSLLQAMHDGKADFTMTFRALADHLRGDGDALDRAFGDVSTIQSWLAQWQERLAREQREPQECAGAMDRVNPLYIARNHKVEEALAAAASGDYRPFETLLEILRDPFAPLKGFETYARPAPEDFGPYVTYCGT